MFSTKAAAEKATLEGQNGDWDTQKCRDLQEDILSGSPPPTDAHAVASQLDVIDVPKIVEVTDSVGVVAAIPAAESGTDKNKLAEAEESSHLDPQTIEPSKEPQPEEPPREQPKLLTNVEINLPKEVTINGEGQTSHPRVALQRDSHGRLAPYHLQGVEYLGANFTKQHQKELAALARTAMDDLTQKSTLSPTQENSESVYERFETYKSIGVPLYQESSPLKEIVQRPQVSNSVPSKHQSLTTDSTAYTYGENDTGHIRLDFAHGHDGHNDQEESQDASYAIPQAEEHLTAPFYEPQTPAPPINPFMVKGSVMKGHELFGATQPSSLGRRLGSPTSSRPSPDVYNDFSSPPKNRRIHSSPLLRGLVTEEISPLQSSVKNLLSTGMPTSSPQLSTTRTPRIQSFDVGRTVVQSSGIREPRAYRSMKHSQDERRRAEFNSRHSPDSDAESFFSSADNSPKRRKTERDKDIQRQLSAVELHRRAPLSSRPLSSSPAVVQVPSTSTNRRRSDAEEYLAQCNDSDARDSQQRGLDMVIADSQKVANSEAQSSTTTSIPADSAGREPEQSSAFLARPPSQPRITDPLINPILTIDSEGCVQPQQDLGQSPEPTLPVREPAVSHNPGPETTRSNDPPQSDMAVPETSQPENWIRPMNEIASFSRLPEVDDSLQDFPGFTQDTEFEHAMRPRPLIGSDGPWLKEVSGLINARSSGASSPSVGSREPPVDLPDDNPPSQAKEPASAAPITISQHLHAILYPTEPREKPVNQINTTLNDNVTSSELSSPPMTEEQPPESETGPDSEKVSSQYVSFVKVTDQTEGHSDITPSPQPSSVGMRSGLRTTAQLKGPSSFLRRIATAKPKPKAGIKKYGRGRRSKSQAKSSPVAPSKTATATLIPSSSPALSDTGIPVSSIVEPLKHHIPARTSRQSTAVVKSRTPDKSIRRTSSRKSGPVPLNYSESTPSSSRSARSAIPRSSARSHKASSEDPLALSPKQKTVPMGLFTGMAFAVSYKGHEQDKDDITAAIVEGGGRLLQEGFDCLFLPVSTTRANTVGNETDLVISEAAKSIGFVALIADEHSRKAKYMQALALGLPCISGQWISACVAKASIIDWSPYLLCAGQSTVLGNAFRSRILQPYLAANATFMETFETRKKFLEGKSILLVMGKEKSDSRKAYVFLTRVLGPDRVCQVSDLGEARAKLLDAEKKGESWDLLHVDANEQAAEAAVFGPVAGGSRKRKRAPTQASENTPVPKRVRVISDEVVIQSLIFGQLLDE